MAEEKDSKTEEPTPRRLAKAREEGQVAKSQEVNSCIVLLTALFMLFFTGSYMYSLLSGIMVDTFQSAGTMTLEGTNVVTFLTDILWHMAALMAPVLAGVVVAAFIANFIQVGFQVSTKSIEPKLTKLNPINGFKRFISKRSLVELVKSISKITIIGTTVYLTVRSEMDTIMLLGDMDVPQIGLYVLAISFKVFLFTIWVLAVIAALDFIFQKWQHHQDMKMTKQEVKEEMKQSEGDPMVKSRIRAAQKEAARKRMMSRVPEADVVVTNPTHLAVALLYDPEQGDAPMVVAKGQSLVAQKIKMLALQHGVPLVEDKPLAQALYKAVEVGETIPVAFYQAVAELLAFIYRQKGKKVNGRAGG